EVLDDWDKIDKRIAREQYYSDCANQYYRLSIGSQTFPDARFSYGKNSYNNEKGFLIYLPVDTLPSGSYELRIESGYQLESKAENAVRIIPFFKR
ncbi:MAG: hypothetical protein AAFP19_22620, partial [Bacteroidota bacterium]